MIKDCKETTTSHSLVLTGNVVNLEHYSQYKIFNYGSIIIVLFKKNTVLVKLGSKFFRFFLIKELV